MLTSQETQTRRNRLFAFEGGLAWQIAVTPLVAATDMDPAVGLTRQTVHLALQWAARHADC